MNENAFSYTYSAPEKQEVLNIRKKYLPREETKLEELKRLDNLVRNSGVTESLYAGMVGCLIFGLGLCLAIEVIGQMIWLGVILGLVGTVGMLAAFPVYRKYFNKAKANFEENRGHNTFAKAKADAKKSWDDAHMTPAQRAEKAQAERDAKIAAAKERTAAANERYDAAKK